MRAFLGVVLGILGIAAIVLMFTTFGAGMTMFWRVAHIVAGIVLIVAAVPMFRTTTDVATSTETVNYDTRRM